MSARSCALVTGASSGIGAAYARALHRRGHGLILVARRADRLQALARELGGVPVVLATDLTSAGAAERLREEAQRRGLDVDLLVNNAGVGHTAPFEQQPIELVRQMIALNVGALVELTHAFLPAMRARGRGTIVNVASNAAFQPVPYLTVYAASKAFVLSFSEGLAEELRGCGVRVQALCPGTTATEFFEVSGTRPELLVSRLPMMSAEAVVAQSLRGLDRGRVRVVAGLPNRLLGFVVQRLAPRGLARRVAGRLYRPPGTDRGQIPAGDGAAGD